MEPAADRTALEDSNLAAVAVRRVTFRFDNSETLKRSEGDRFIVDLGQVSNWSMREGKADSGIPE